MKALSLFFFLLFSNSLIAQSVDFVGELIASENYFASLVKNKGLRKAFLKMSGENAIVFRPGPVSVQKFYGEQPDSIGGSLSWEPVLARVCKSGDWGFTSGPYVYKPSDSSSTTYYGDYLSIWKKNSKGVWKLALDIGITHKKPASKPALNYANPSNNKFIHQRSKARLQQREDIVFSSDKLNSTIEKADHKIALNEFISEDCRLLFPGFEPIIGKEKIIAFWEKQGLKKLSAPHLADRSYSGEYAFTRGETIITTKKGKDQRYHYVRIWEVQPGFKWNIAVEVYTEAVEKKAETAENN